MREVKQKPKTSHFASALVHLKIRHLRWGVHPCPNASPRVQAGSLRGVIRIHPSFEADLFVGYTKILHTGVSQHFKYVLSYVCMYGHTCSKSMDQPGKVANPARGQLNRENEYFPVRIRA